MGRKITAIRFDIRGGSVDVRALSKNRKGAQFILRALPRVKAPEEKAHLKELVKERILELLVRAQ